MHNVALISKAICNSKALQLFKKNLGIFYALKLCSKGIVIAVFVYVRWICCRQLHGDFSRNTNKFYILEKLKKIVRNLE